MAHSIVTWLNTPDTWSVDEQDFTTTEVRYLVVEKGLIKTFDGNAWVDTGLTEPITDTQYLEHGIEGLSEVTESGWGSLSDKFELIAWEQDLDLVGNMWLELTTQEFSPLSLLNEEDEFEVLTYSNKAKVSKYTKASNDGVVDAGQVFVTELDIFDTIARVTLL